MMTTNDLTKIMFYMLKFASHLGPLPGGERMTFPLPFGERVRVRGNPNSSLRKHFIKVDILLLCIANPCLRWSPA